MVKQDHRRWRYHCILLDYVSPYLLPIEVPFGSSKTWGSSNSFGFLKSILSFGLHSLFIKMTFNSLVPLSFFHSHYCCECRNCVKSITSIISCWSHSQEGNLIKREEVFQKIILASPGFQLVFVCLQRHPSEGMKILLQSIKKDFNFERQFSPKRVFPLQK